MFTVITVVLCIVTIVLYLLVSYIKILYNCQRKAKVLISNNLITNNKHHNSSSNSNSNNNNSNTHDHNSNNNNDNDQNSEQIFMEYEQAPGPKPWPIIGNLNLLGQYAVPFQGFTELAKKFGDVYCLTLGTTRCLIVNNLELIREVLNQNGKFFGGRPDFLRYHKLFGGDRNNSLALCDWSHLQQKRRNLARRHCSPRDSSSYFNKMSNIGCFETHEFMQRLNEVLVPGEPFQIKQLIQQTCANMFSQYMCSVRFDYDDTEYQRIVEYFDEIFWEINQGYAVDFLPWLAPFYKQHIKKIIHWSTTIRKFILERIIDDREQNIDLDEPEKDFTDALLKSLVEDKNVSRETIIFMLEDFIGGHSAVGNLVMLALTYVAKNPNIAARIQAEVDSTSNNCERKISLYDMESMPYTLATIFEVLRYSSSPIVPHVATEDTVIAGHGVTAGTIVFINNYNLNTNEKYWNHPEIFDPERFLEKISLTSKKHIAVDVVQRRNSEGSDSGVEFDKDVTINKSSNNADSLHIQTSKKLQNNNDTTDKESTNNSNNKTTNYKIQIKKNIPHFLPFSIGKRTCIGQNLVRGFGFILLANILQQYDVSSKDLSAIKINPACVALPAKTHPLIFTKRSPKF